MKPMAKIYILDENNQKIFGEGPYQLLLAVQETGSLRQAALSMHMAYTKAHKLIAAAEKAYHTKLLTPTIGGSLGGGSTLTEEGKELIQKYARYRKESKEANARIYHQIFEQS